MSEFRCSHCGQFFSFNLPATLNASTHPELKEKILSGEYFLRQCPHCSGVNLVMGDMLYIDTDQKLLLCLSDKGLSSAGEVPEFTCRLVTSVGELIEKIKIHDSGLDDVVVEMCKFVTLQELAKDVDLKFYRLEGADNEIIFAYPENGEMQMLGVGLNVYEDCQGILSRNPHLSEHSKGLVRIDRDWLLGFVG